MPGWRVPLALFRSTGDPMYAKNGTKRSFRQFFFDRAFRFVCVFLRGMLMTIEWVDGSDVTRTEGCHQKQRRDTCFR